MIRLERPNMAVNDPRVSRNKRTRRFQMWKTLDVDKDTSIIHIILEVRAVARGAPGGRLKHLVLSAHGAPGALQLGTGLNALHLPSLLMWRGYVEKIWLPNCRVARHLDPEELEEERRRRPNAFITDGREFCARMARQVRCYVVAPTELQCERLTDLPPDHMTSFEGLVACFGPDGRVSWTHRNPSLYIDHRGICVPVPD